MKVAQKRGKVLVTLTPEEAWALAQDMRAGTALRKVPEGMPEKLEVCSSEAESYSWWQAKK